MFVSSATPCTAVLYTVAVSGLLLLASAPTLAVPQARTHAAAPGESLAAAPSVPRSVGPSSPEVSIQSFLATSNPGLAGVQLKTIRSFKSPTGVTHLQQQQYGPGSLRIVGAYVKSAHSSSGQLLHVVENLAPAADVTAAAQTASSTAALGASDVALAAALKNLGYSDATEWWQPPTVERVLLRNDDGSSLWPGFKVTTWTKKDNQLDYTYVTADGQVQRSVSATRDAKVVNGKFAIFDPSPLGPTPGSRGVITNSPTANQVLVMSTKKGSKSPSPSGWLDPTFPQNTQAIKGNNVYAYLDLNDDDTPDDPTATGGSNVTKGVFSTVAKLAGDDPTTVDNRNVAVQNLFYWTNLAHDVLYKAGFVESAGNFQGSNFNKFGGQGDYLLAEAQDGGGLNNANMATPDADGQSPRMQMYLWSTTIGPSVSLGDQKFDAGDNAFGPSLTAFNGFSAPLVLSIFPQGCQAVAGGSYLGSIVIIDRGNCSFQAKVGYAQSGGAAGVIIVNVQGDFTITMASDNSYTGPAITIPAVMVTQTAGATLKASAAIPQPATFRTARNNTGYVDGSLDAGIILHEYAHGLTGRVVSFPYYPPIGGGFSEGASDVLSLLVLGDDRIGTYANSALILPTDVNDGIRRYRYKGYPLTYADVTGGEVHSDGEIYAATMWRLKELYDSAGLTTTGPYNNKLLFDWVNGLFYAPSDPTYEQARDGLLAHLQYYNDKQTRYCLAWKAFAEFGIGVGALGDQQWDNAKNDYVVTVTASFAMPPECQGPSSKTSKIPPMQRSTAPPNAKAHGSGTSKGLASE